VSRPLFFSSVSVSSPFRAACVLYAWESRARAQSWGPRRTTKDAFGVLSMPLPSRQTAAWPRIQSRLLKSISSHRTKAFHALRRVFATRLGSHWDAYQKEMHAICLESATVIERALLAEGTSSQLANSARRIQRLTYKSLTSVMRTCFRSPLKLHQTRERCMFIETLHE